MERSAEGAERNPGAAVQSRIARRFAALHAGYNTA
jgi:hypothetical protein